MKKLAPGRTGSREYTIVKSFSFDRKLLARLTLLAKQERRPLSNFLNWLLAEALRAGLVKSDGKD